MNGQIIFSIDEIHSIDSCKEVPKDPRKNIKLFNKKPLIFWSIKAAIESDFVDRVIVSTDDEEIAEISKSLSAEIPFLRPKKLAQDDSPGIDPVIHALNNLKCKRYFVASTYISFKKN